MSGTFAIAVANLNKKLYDDDCKILRLLFAQDGAIQVKAANPNYGDMPYAVQTGWCEQPGDLIHVTADYLTGVGTGDSAALFGPPKNIFVSEWAK